MFFIRQNEVFIFFTWQYPHNKSRITPFSSNISVTIYRKMPNRARGLKQRNTTFTPLPLPSPAVLRGITYKIEAEAKGKYISPSSSVFCAAKYRGGVQRTEGLKTSAATATKSSIKLSSAVSRSITGCFAQQNIGEVAEGRRG